MAGTHAYFLQINVHGEACVTLTHIFVARNESQFHLGWEMKSWLILCSENSNRVKHSTVQLSSCSWEPQFYFQGCALFWLLLSWSLWSVSEIFASKCHPNLGNWVPFCFSEMVIPVSESFAGWRFMRELSGKSHPVRFTGFLSRAFQTDNSESLGIDLIQPLVHS